MKSILPQNKEIENHTTKFLKGYQIGRLMKASNFKKEKGFSNVYLFQFIFVLVFIGKNLYRYLQTEVIERDPAKDSVYRFLNSTRYNWRKFLLLLSSAIITETVSILTSAKRVRVLIVDDSLFSRSRSKAVELLARVYDHVEHRFVRGFRLLTIGWSDGNTFLPLGFSLLSSENENNRICEMRNDIDKRSNGYKIRKEGIKKATDVLIELLAQVSAYNVPAQYLLFDSWFSYPKVIKRVLENNMHVICMVKEMPKVFYTYMGQKMNLTKIYSAVRKRCGRARILASVIVDLGKDSNGELVKAKLVFVRDRSGSKKWLALLSTDVSLSDEEVIRIYGKRWDIEVFFKMSKSYLQLVKEFQGRSYDAMIAHTTIVFCRYIMLAVEKRNNEDSRAFGELFYYCCDELQDIKFAEALFLLMKILMECAFKYFMLSEETIKAFMSYFLAHLPLFYREKLQLSMCES